MDEYDIGAPTIEVIVRQHGAVVARELCESAEEAAEVVERWSEVEGVACVVADLGVDHRPDEILGEQQELDDDEDRSRD
jgi:hypothetical protein